MRIHSRKLAFMFVVAGTALAASPVAAAFAADGGGSSIGTFRVFADANGIGATLNQPSSSPSQPVAALAPYAYSELGSGPAGLALSSVGWPGSLAGNAGGLVNVIGTPLPPDVVANANDPVKAQAQSSGGTRDEETVGPMYALVDGTSTLARTALTDFNSPGVVSAVRALTRSRTYVDDAGKLVSTAESVLQGVDINGGLIHIESITTTATGTTDGSNATTDQKTTVTGVTVQGQPCTIDEKGMRCGGNASDNPLAGVANGFNTAFASAGMEAFVTKPSAQKTSAGDGSISSGSVIFVWTMDPNDILVLTLGGASVTMSATPGSGGTLSDLGGDSGAFTGGAGASVGDFASTGPSFGTGSSSGAGSPSRSGASSTVGRGGTATATPLALNDVTPVSDRVPAGWMIVGVLGALMLASGLHGLRTKALEGALLSSACPLESERGAS